MSRGFVLSLCALCRKRQFVHIIFVHIIFVPLDPPPPPNQQNEGFPLEFLLEGPQTELRTLSQNCEETLQKSGVNKSARERIGRQNLSQKVPSKRGLSESYFLQGIIGKTHTQNLQILREDTLGATCSAGPFPRGPQDQKKFEISSEIENFERE